MNIKNEYFKVKEENNADNLKGEMFDKTKK